MILNDTIVTKLEEAFAGDTGEYATGFRDALESFVLALQGTLAEGMLVDGLESALDAYANNVNDFEDDGQPDERQEWFDYDPDC